MTRGRLMNTVEGAEYLGVSVVRMRRLIRRGEISVLRDRHGRFIGVYASALDAWVDRSTRPARVAAVTPASPTSAGVDAAMAKLMPATRRYAS